MCHEETFTAFREHLDQTQIAKNPDKIVHITIQTWNGFVSRMGADLPLLTKPASRRFIIRPLSDYPQSFRDDLQAWLDRLSQSVAVQASIRCECRSPAPSKTACGTQLGDNKLTEILEGVRFRDHGRMER